MLHGAGILWYIYLHVGDFLDIDNYSNGVYGFITVYINPFEC